MTTLYYVLQVVQDVDPVLHGPYKTNAGRDRKARRLREECDEDLKDGLYPLDLNLSAPNLTETGEADALADLNLKLSVSCYSGGFFEESRQLKDRTKRPAQQPHGEISPEAKAAVSSIMRGV